MFMIIRKEKKEFISTLTRLLLLLQEKEKNPLYDLSDLARDAQVDRNLLGRWMSDNYTNLPGADYGIKLANFFIGELGCDGMAIYDSLGWERPICE